VATRYPILDTILWPYFHARPSLRNYSGVARHPLSHRFEVYREDEVTKLVFFGDLCCMYGEELVSTSEGVREVFSGADRVFGNLEAPITQRARHTRPIVGFRFRMSESFLDDLLGEFGIEPQRCLLSLANNHIGDWSLAGYDSTLTALESRGIRVLGRCRDDRPQAEEVVVDGWLKLGVVAWTRWLNRRPFAPGDRVLEDVDLPAVDWAERKREAGWHLLLGLPHWDYEFKHFPRAETRDLARGLAAGGFDLLVGHHPHVLQPLEWFGDTICHYSLGNFLAIQLTWPTKLTTLLEVHVLRTGGRRGRVCGYRQIPLALQTGQNKRRRLVTLDEVPLELRKQCHRRLEQLFEV
jgi:poly-gamma-glutamate capsule biosynthesis protein CapA/YwtB (metallophosphatase superfamily)